MINIEQSVSNRLPWIGTQPALIKRPTFGLLRKLIHEQEINGFLEEHQTLRNFSFIDRIFDYFQFGYAMSANSRANIPAEGRVVIVANHPIGSLDGLALLRAVGEIRQDVKIVANNLLASFDQLQGLLLPLDNMGRSGFRKSYKAIVEALERDEAVIVFPSGEVSRASPAGIRDGKWQTGFLHFARKTGAPILPVHINAKNSAFFYGLSAIYKPLSTLWLAREMFNKNRMDISLTVGDPIPIHALTSEQVADQHLCKRLKKYLYKLGRGKAKGFVTEKTIAHPEPANQVKKQLESCVRLGQTRDEKIIYLCGYAEDTPLFRELGRLRELTFRKVGEGTGSRRDLDAYDHRYQHLVLWDNHQLRIAGAYRIGDCGALIAEGGLDQLYTSELFQYQASAIPMLEHAIELGRSFVNPAYWGKNSLDYLWQGIGALLAHKPGVRYLIGPVSMSADTPKHLRDRLVHHYRNFHAARQSLAISKTPYRMENHVLEGLDLEAAECDAEISFKRLQAAFAAEHCKLPVLYKQYAALFSEGGFSLLDFGVDADFGHCVDGLFVADLDKLKPAKRKRYLQCEFSGSSSA